MSTAADYVRARLVELGWTVAHVVEPALIVEGRDLRVMNVVATREALRCLLVVFLADGEEAERYAALNVPSIAIASKVLPERGWTIRATVHDLEGARVELEHLRTWFQRSAGTFEGCVALFESRGWQIDRTRSKETTLDQPGWEIRAARGGELLDVGMTFGWNSGPDRVEVGDFTFATLVSENVNAFASLVSRDHAERLVRAL